MLLAIAQDFISLADKDVRVHFIGDSLNVLQSQKMLK